MIAKYTRQASLKKASVSSPTGTDTKSFARQFSRQQSAPSAAEKSDDEEV